MSSPRTARIRCLRGNGQMGNVANACQCLSSKPIRPDGGKVLKGFELRRSEPFTQDGQVIFLIKTFQQACLLTGQLAIAMTDINSMAIVCDLE